jgi:hypothetical protein
LTSHREFENIKLFNGGETRFEIKEEEGFKEKVLEIVNTQIHCGGEEK